MLVPGPAQASQVPPELLGPVGALVLAILVLGGLVKVLLMLWHEHLKADEDDRAQRDRALAIVADLVPAVKAMAAAWEARNKADAARRRRGDP